MTGFFSMELRSPLIKQGLFFKNQLLREDEFDTVGGQQVQGDIVRKRLKKYNRFCFQWNFEDYSNDKNKHGSQIGWITITFYNCKNKNCFPNSLEKKEYLRCLQKRFHKTYFQKSLTVFIANEYNGFKQNGFDEFKQMRDWADKMNMKKIVIRTMGI